MKKMILIVIVVLIGIQFIQPEKNISTSNSMAIENIEEVPVEIESIISKSCADCHSNSTNYPWYNTIAPVSWYLANHINEGKEHLNFSEWGNYNNNQKKHIIKDLEEVLESHEMPLKSYILLHKEAMLTNAEYELFLNWVKNLEVKE